MNDRTNESLSALVDGETDELEVRRLLNQLETDDELRDRWARYQMIGALMRNEAAVNVDLSRGIMQAIEGEPMDDVVRPKADIVAHAAHKMRWLASGAVAATVTLAVLVGVRVMQPDDAALPLAANAPMTPVLVSQNNAAVQLASAEAPVVDQAQLEEAQKKLQEYVLQHTEQTNMGASRGIMPYARVVNFGVSEEQR
ncbi:sigma-E factor negative regulatory protein [Thalassolituus sp. LLYu03]|uniref:sigma-E factor negative regulatory protein n=1 Tax=Thalassolituus sp. LLYu03 TaxID=3421656 RepID=UPI003D2A7E1F